MPSKNLSKTVTATFKTSKAPTKPIKTGSKISKAGKGAARAVKKAKTAKKYTAEPEVGEPQETILYAPYRLALKQATGLDKEIAHQINKILTDLDAELAKLKKKHRSDTDHPDVRSKVKLVENQEAFVQKLEMRRGLMDTKLENFKRFNEEAIAKQAASDSSPDTASPANANASLVAGAKRKADSLPPPPQKKVKVNSSEPKAGKITPSTPNAKSATPDRNAPQPCTQNCNSCAACFAAIEARNKQKSLDLLASYKKFNYASVMSQPKATNKIAPPTPSFGFVAPMGSMVATAPPPAPMVSAAPGTAIPAQSAATSTKKRKASADGDAREVKKSREDSYSPASAASSATSVISQPVAPQPAQMVAPPAPMVTSSPSEPPRSISSGNKKRKASSDDDNRDVKKARGNSSSPESTPSISTTPSIDGNKVDSSEDSKTSSDSDVKKALDSTSAGTNTSTPTTSSDSSTDGDKGPACENVNSSDTNGDSDSLIEPSKSGSTQHLGTASGSDATRRTKKVPKNGFRASRSGVEDSNVEA